MATRMNEIGDGGEQAEDSLTSFLAALQAENGANNASVGAGAGAAGGNNLGGLSLGATSTASMKDLLAAWGAGNMAFEASAAANTAGISTGTGTGPGSHDASMANLPNLPNLSGLLPTLSQDDFLVALQMQQQNQQPPPPQQPSRQNRQSSPMVVGGAGSGTISGTEEEAMMLPSHTPTTATTPSLEVPTAVPTMSTLQQPMPAMPAIDMGVPGHLLPTATNTTAPPKRKRRHPGRPPSSTQAAATAVAREAAQIMARVAAEQPENVAQARIDQDAVRGANHASASGSGSSRSRSRSRSGRRRQQQQQQQDQQQGTEKETATAAAAAQQVSRQQLLQLQRQQQARQQQGQQGSAGGTCTSTPNSVPPPPQQQFAPFQQQQAGQQPNQPQAAFAAAAAAAAAAVAGGGVPAPFLAQMASNPAAFLQMMMMQQQAQQVQAQQAQQQIQQAAQAQAQQIQAHMIQQSQQQPPPPPQPGQGPPPLSSPPPPPTGAMPTPAMAAAAAAARAEAAIDRKDRKSRAAYAFAAPPNVVSCSDTDGLTTDAESSRKRVAPGGGGGGRPSKQKKEAAAMAIPSMLEGGMSYHLSAASSTPIASGSSAMSSLLPSASDRVTAQQVKETQARARNREHARNTRLRKKEYQEKLKATVEDLCRERDVLVSERAGAANLLVEMHNTRTDVLLSFFALRSANERRRELWSSILDESCFSCLLPVTPYRSFPASEVQAGCQRTVLGIDGAMSDTASLHVLLNSLVDRSRYPNARIRFQYTLVTEDAVVAGNQMMARWVMTTLNAKEFGAKMEVSKRGMLSCKFNSAHKLTSLEMMFDVMAFMLQLKQAAGTDSFAVVPNTVQTCQRSFGLPMVMTMADRPHTIVQVNQLWEEMTGFKAEDVVGRASCQVLEGNDTETSNLELLMSDVNHKRPTNVALTNYTKAGKRFQNHINVFPLSTDSKITHYIALTTYCGLIDGRGANAPAPAPINVEYEATKATAKKPIKSALKKDAESIETHQAVAPVRQSSSFSLSSQQASGKTGEQSKPKVVVAGPTNRHDSSGGGDTISSLTSSLSCSNSDDGSNSNANNSSTSTSEPDAQNNQKNPRVSITSSADTAAEVASRKTATTGSSMSLSASGSTSTNGSSSDDAKTESEEKTNRKRVVDAASAGDKAKAKKQRVSRRG